MVINNDADLGSTFGQRLVFAGFQSPPSVVLKAPRPLVPA